MKRVEWIDTAKGICIILVVLNHLCIYSGIIANNDNYIVLQFNNFLTSFRMPLYFVLSGLFFKTYGGGLMFFRKKTNKLIIPFVFFYILSADIIPLIYKKITLHSLIGIDNLNFIEQLLDIFYYCCQNTNGPLWFLLCLFEVNFLFFIFHSISKGNVLIVYCSSILSGIIGLSMSYFDVLLPLSLSTSFTCLPFFAFGYYIRNTSKLLQRSKIDNHLLCYAAVCALFCAIIARHVIYYKNEFYNTSYFSAHICGILGTMMILLLSKRIGKTPVLSYYGKYSIITLCTHYPIYVLLDNTLFAIIYIHGWGKMLISFFLVFLLELILIPISINYLPHVTAQKDLL